MLFRSPAAAFSQQPASAPDRMPAYPAFDRTASGAPVPPVGAAPGFAPPPPSVFSRPGFSVQASAAAPSSQSSFENVLGKNVLGIVASILVFLGIVFLGVLVVPYLGDGFRCALMYLVSLAFLVLGFALSLRRRSPLSLAFAWDFKTA